MFVLEKKNYGYCTVWTFKTTAATLPLRCPGRHRYSTESTRLIAPAGILRAKLGQLHMDLYPSGACNFPNPTRHDRDSTKKGPSFILVGCYPVRHWHIVESIEDVLRGHKGIYIRADYSLSSPKKPSCMIAGDATFRCFLRLAFFWSFSAGLESLSG